MGWRSICERWCDCFARVSGARAGPADARIAATGDRLDAGLEDGGDLAGAIRACGDAVQMDRDVRGAVSTPQMAIFILHNTYYQSELMPLATAFVATPLDVQPSK